MDFDCFERQIHNEDSFAFSEQNIQEPRKFPYQNELSQDYELTFKKSSGQDILSKQQLKEIKRKHLFHQPTYISTHNEIKNCDVNKVIKRIDDGEINIIDIEEMLENDACSEIQKKVMAIKQSLQLKVVWKKFKSARMNKRIMESKEQKSQEQNHKLYLLKLLVGQLQKKLFIFALKYNYYVKKYSQSRLSSNSKSQNQKLQSYSNQSHDLSKFQKHLHEGSYLSQPKLAIFLQIINCFIHKTTYSAFNQLKYASLQSDNEILSRDNSFEEESRRCNELLLDKNRKIEELFYYIQKLRSQIKVNPISNQRILRNYFIKWKIFFLNKMIQLIQNDPQQSNEFPISQSQNLFASNLEVSTLKEEKKYLKSHIKFTQGCLFLNLLQENSSQSQLKKIGVKMYFQTLKRKVFISLLENVEKMKRKVALELYAEEITNCQVGDELTSIIFDKTNLITKSFFILKNNRKCVKFSSILNKTFIKLTFRFLIHSDQSNLKRLFFVSKFLERKNKFTCFKIFQILKQQTSLSMRNKSRLLQFEQKKQTEVKHFYFSVWSLEQKKYMVKRRKADLFYHEQIKQKYFDYLKMHYQERIYERNKERNLEIYGEYFIKRKSIQTFVNNYLSSLQNKKVSIKQEKLSLLLWKRRIGKMLIDWRKSNLQIKSYQAIEIRLIKLKQRQTKSKIWKKWFLKMTQNKEKNSKFYEKLLDNDDHHKSWLLNYYQNLCSIDK